MREKILFMVLLTAVIASACGGGQQQEAALPTGIASLNLGDTFDTESENVHVFGDEDGSLYYVYDDGNDSGPINVDVDVDGRITRLSWEQQVHSDERMREVMSQAEQRFGAYLKDKATNVEGTRMYFEDGATAYTLMFIGHTITLTTEPMSTGEGQ